MIVKISSAALLTSLIGSLLLLTPHRAASFDDAPLDNADSAAFDGMQPLPPAAAFFAPFTCGMDPQGVIARVLPGQYASAVNIANAGSRPATVRAHVALTFPNASGSGAIEPGPVSPPIELIVQPGEAFEVDCGEVPSQFFPGQQLPPYIQGFVVVSGPHELVVHVVSTAGQVDAAGNVNVVSLEVEQIEGRPTIGR